MASRRSHAAYHSRTASQRRVPRGHVFIRNPLQAPKERSCGTSRLPLTISWFRKAGPTILLNIIVEASVPLRGTIFMWRSLMYPQLRCFAACSGFHDIGPALRNPQLILNLLVVRGCVATAGRHSLLCLHSCSFIISPINCNSSINSTE